MTQFDKLPQTSSDSPSHHLSIETLRWIQPHGSVLLLQGEEARVIRVSQNVETGLENELDIQALLGQRLHQWLGETAAEQIRAGQRNLLAWQASSPNADSMSQPQYIPLTLASGQSLEGWLHFGETYWVLELEPTATHDSTQRFNLHRLQPFRAQVAQFQQAPTQDDLLQSAAIATQQLTHFERVLIYRFAADGSGTVVAEAHSPHTAFSDISYLGLCFPATDIPKSSRRQYARGGIRYVPDLQAEPVGFIPAFDSAEEANDLRHALLRSVDDCCITYHGNIGVRAFLVIPLLNQGKLWGLLVGHHSTPVSLPASIRLDCAWLGQILSAELAQKESQTALSERERLKAYQSEFLAAIAQSDDFIQDLIEPELRLLGLANAHGAAIFFEGQVTVVGAAPLQEFLNELYDWASTQVDESIYRTHTLPQVYPVAEAHKDIASGLLFLLISSARRYAIAWFRPEVQQTVRWAGNPADSYTENDAGEQELCPRASFAQWQETVRLTSLPWQSWEIESALDLRNAVVGVVLRKADEITRINRELERSNQELAAFAYAASHDLKEPLRGINNYARLLIRENQDYLSEKAVERLNTLTKLTRRMGRLIDALLRFSRIGQTELNLHTIDLNLLIARVVEMQELSHPTMPLEIWTPRPLPSVRVDPVLLTEVYNNFLSNALKYNTDDSPWAELGYYDAEEIEESPHIPDTFKAPVLYVRDNGIGIPEQHWERVFELFKRLHTQKKYGGGTGAGLTITKKIIERHGGQIGVFSDENGTTFYWSLG